MSALEELQELPSRLQKNALRSILRKERERAEITQKDAASRVVWSLSKLIRIENGINPITPADVRLLLLEYGTPEPKRGAVVELAKGARQRDVFARFRKYVDAEAMHTVLDYETAAQSIRAFEPFLVPGMLQTREYALGVLKDRRVPEDKAQQIWETREARQRVLWASDNTTDVNIIIHEAALCVRVGSDDAMLRQIQQLKDFAENYQRRVTLQVFPFAAGMPRGIDRAFMMFNTRNPYVDDVVYREDAGGVVHYLQDHPQEFDEHEAMFWELWNRANEGNKNLATRGRFVAHLERISKTRFATTARNGL